MSGLEAMARVLCREAAMVRRSFGIGTLFFAAATVMVAAPSFAQTAQQVCGDEWKKLTADQKKAAGPTWNDYRPKCLAKAKGDAAAPAAAPAAAAPAKPAAAAPAAPAKPAAAAPAAAGAAKFPSAVDPKYAKESAGKQRMHTCLDQYNANKASNANGGLKWIEKGGGYYSQCNKLLGGGAG